MKRIVYLLVCLVMGAAAGVARNPIRQWFAVMPDSVMPLLTKNNRLDFIDFLDCNMEAVVTNRMDGKSRMEVLTEDYLLVRYTPSCDVAMKLLAVDDTTDVLCMVTTVKAAVSDSRVAFFDGAWRPLETEDFFKEPQLDDFRSVERSDSADAAWKKMDTYFKTYSLSPDEPVLTCRLTTMDYLGREDRKVVEPYLKSDSIVYRWSLGKWQVELTDKARANERESSLLELSQRV